MASEFKLKGVSSFDLKEGEKQEAEVEGIEDAKVLLVNSLGRVHAVSPKCTHYGAPLKNGVVCKGRLTCPWHGASFNIATGDVEDAPALDPIANFDIVQRDGAVYIKGDESTIKANRKTLDISCKAEGQEKVVIVGGGSGATAAVEALRGRGFKGPMTVLASEGVVPYDRTKLSKALLADHSKVAWRTPSFYKSGNVDIVAEEATSVDFGAKTVATKSGSAIPYTKLILATGGTPRSLPLPGLKEGELKNVFLLRNLTHTQGINAALGSDPKKVVVIGSSFIGMEAANALAGQKHDVTVIGMESAPTEAVFGAKVGNIFRGMLEKNGVKFHMGASVAEAGPSSSDPSCVGAVHLKDGTKLEADVVVEGVGVAPATTFLKNSKDGPSLEKDGSVKVDADFAVPNLPGVYAIGDIATYPYRGTHVRIEHWNVAQNAGRTVAKAIAQPSSKREPFVPVFWSALGSQLRYCGNTVGGYDDVIIQGERSGPPFAAFYVRGDDVVAVATMGKDPIMVQSAELMRQGRMLGRKDVEQGADVMAVSL